jgi:hypothetical protein
MEREHAKVYASMERDARAQLARKICGLCKFWVVKGMRAQVRLLQMLVNFWDLEIEAFNIDGKPLSIEVYDIYFIIGLSHQEKFTESQSPGGWGWYEHRGLHFHQLCSYMDLGVSLIATCIKATHVLCSGVFTTHGLGLVCLTPG